MQFSKVLLAAAAFVVASAQPLITNTPSDFVGVTAGSTFDITWSNATGSVTLLLKTGEANALTTVSTIASGLTGSSYSWSIPSSIVDGTYAFEIDDASGVPNYSVRFAIGGGSASSSSTSGSSTASSTRSSSTSGSSTGSSSTASTTSTGSSSSTSGSASTTSTPTISSNSTASATESSTTTKKTSSTKTSASSTGTSSSTSAPNSTGSAANLASPLALVFLAFAAILTLN